MKPIEFRKKSNLGIYGLYLLVRYEFKVFFENKGTLLNQLVTPTLYFIFICLGINRINNEVIYFGDKVTYLEYSFTGIVIIIIMSQMSQTIYRTTIDKRYGLLTLKILSGVRPSYYILGMSTYSVLGLLFQESVLIIIASLFGVNFTFHKIIMLIASSVLILMFWSAIAVVITLRINNYEVRDNIISFVLTPLGFTAPVFYVLEYVPSWMQFIAKINPVTYQLGAIRSGFFEGIYMQPIFILIILLCLSVYISSLLITKADLKLNEY
ncbi:ABC transporter permease [Aerococcaceae bacterium zg-ZJ1578]|uniref:ABC transporter permease n=1 Tax=Aerococcaceae bacterium zg-252 TaxID=2796928 RepID=UPI001A1FC539|nr:ABC transporter permease [Aerococcaceae bacterium zg-1578]